MSSTRRAFGVTLAVASLALAACRGRDAATAPALTLADFRGDYALQLFGGQMLPVRIVATSAGPDSPPVLLDTTAAVRYLVDQRLTLDGAGGGRIVDRVAVWPPNAGAGAAPDSVYEDTSTVAYAVARRRFTLTLSPSRHIGTATLTDGARTLALRFPQWGGGSGMVVYRRTDE